MYVGLQMHGDTRPRDGLSMMVSSVTDLGENGILKRSGSEDEGEKTGVGVGGRMPVQRWLLYLEAGLSRNFV